MQEWIFCLYYFQSNTEKAVDPDTDSLSKEGKLQEQVDLLKELMINDKQVENNKEMEGKQITDKMVEAEKPDKQMTYGSEIIDSSKAFDSVDAENQVDLDAFLDDNDVNFGDLLDGGNAKSKAFDSKGMHLPKESAGDGSKLKAENDIETARYLAQLLEEDPSQSEYIPQLLSPKHMPDISQKNGLLRTLVSQKSLEFNPSQRKFYSSPQSSQNNFNKQYTKQLENMYDQFVLNRYDKSKERLRSGNIFESDIDAIDDKYFEQNPPYYGPQDHQTHPRSQYNWYDPQEYNELE